MVEWLTSSGLDHRLPLRATRIGLGQSNLIFEITDADDRRWILRRPPLGRLLSSAHDVVREARILTALAGTDVPVPRIVDLATDDGVPVVLMEHVAGLVIDRPVIAAALSPQHRRAVGIALPRTLARIHAVNLDDTGLADLASHKPYAERQLKRWTAQWERTKTRDVPRVDRLAERLRAAIPPQRELGLVHGDFHIRNVITDPVGGDITAVLDWELCTLGDPLADLGSLLAYWPQPGERETDSFAMCALPGFPSRAELVTEYVAATARDVAALGFWHALGLWKIAVIREGVLRRTRDDPRNQAIGAVPTIAQIDAVIDAADAAATHAGL
nr:phosphotransferase family protein [Nocardia aurantia]